MIDISVKKKCLELHAQGQEYRQIYNDFYHEINPNASFATFDSAMRKWKKKFCKDETILEGANLSYKFIPHDSTVQVDKRGNVIQAWIKQHTDDSNVETLKAEFKTMPQLPSIPHVLNDIQLSMLEIPLFDMHFGIANLSYYVPTHNRVISLIEAKEREEINIIVGQDLFHNNDLRGNTASGRPIQQVNMEQAIRDAKTFFTDIIDTASKHSKHVKVIYSKGNHDECTAWLFSLLLEQMFGQYKNISFNTTTDPRKIIYWRGCFIGVKHGEKKQDDMKGLVSQFLYRYPVEFSQAKVREIHTGHIHKEERKKDSDADTNGAMIRHLASGCDVDGWSNEEGYIGAHKRFMTFEYEPDRLARIEYV
jgi:hypothetical protein